MKYYLEEDFFEKYIDIKDEIFDQFNEACINEMCKLDQDYTRKLLLEILEQSSVNIDPSYNNVKMIAREDNGDLFVFVDVNGKIGRFYVSYNAIKEDRVVDGDVLFKDNIKYLLKSKTKQMNYFYVEDENSHQIMFSDYWLEHVLLQKIMKKFRKYINKKEEDKVIDFLRTKVTPKIAKRFLEELLPQKKYKKVLKKIGKKQLEGTA